MENIKLNKPFFQNNKNYCYFSRLLKFVIGSFPASHSCRLPRESRTPSRKRLSAGAIAANIAYHCGGSERQNRMTNHLFHDFGPKSWNYRIFATVVHSITVHRTGTYFTGCRSNYRTGWQSWASCFRGWYQWSLVDDSCWSCWYELPTTAIDFSLKFSVTQSACEFISRVAF